MINLPSLSDFLTPGEISLAKQLKHGVDIDREIITPNIGRISTALGQDMHARYVGYMVEHLLNTDKKEITL